MSVLRQTLSNQRIIARPLNPKEHGRQIGLGKHSLCLRSLQRQKRRPNPKARRDEADPEAHQAEAQSTRSRSSRPPTLPKLEAVPRPRLLVRRTKVTPLGVITNVQPPDLSGGFFIYDIRDTN